MIHLGAIGGRIVGAALPALLLVYLCGCGGQEPVVDDYSAFGVSTQQARQALAAGLDAWQNGKSEALALDSVKVQMVDRRWREGRKLSCYHILKEETAQNAARRFAVQLHLDGRNSAALVAHYLILGIEPIWVVREEDFSMCGADTGGPQDGASDSKHAGHHHHSATTAAKPPAK